MNKTPKKSPFAYRVCLSAVLLLFVGGLLLPMFGVSSDDAVYASMLLLAGMLIGWRPFFLASTCLAAYVLICTMRSDQSGDIYNGLVRTAVLILATTIARVGVEFTSAKCAEVPFKSDSHA